MHRKQKTVKTDYSCEDRLEAESNMKVPSIVHTETAREESAEKLLELILSRPNMAEAYNLIRLLREEIKDERVIHLIRKYLKAGVLENGLISPTTEGTPQGGNL